MVDTVNRWRSKKRKLIKEYPSHNCGKAPDYCYWQDTIIFFCRFCKKVTGAAKESDIEITIDINSDVEINEYSEQTLKENV